MEIHFGTTDAALHFGPPSEKERLAIEAFAGGDSNRAERIVDEIVAENPSRIRFIYFVVVPPERTLLAMKYRDLKDKIEGKKEVPGNASSVSLSETLQSLPSYEDALKEESQEIQQRVPGAVHSQFEQEGSSSVAQVRESWNKETLRMRSKKQPDSGQPHEEENA